MEVETDVPLGARRFRDLFLLLDRVRNALDVFLKETVVDIFKNGPFAVDHTSLSAAGLLNGLKVEKTHKGYLLALLELRLLACAAAACTKSRTNSSTALPAALGDTWANLPASSSIHHLNWQFHVIGMYEKPGERSCCLIRLICDGLYPLKVSKGYVMGC